MTLLRLVECSHSLGELGFDLRQRLSSLQGLLQLLFGIIKTLLKLPVLLFTLQESGMSGSAGGTRTAIEDCRGQKDMFKAVGGEVEKALMMLFLCQCETQPSCQSAAET